MDMERNPFLFFQISVSKGYTMFSSLTKRYGQTAIVNDLNSLDTGPHYLVRLGGWG